MQSRVHHCYVQSDRRHLIQSDKCSGQARKGSLEGIAIEAYIPEVDRLPKTAPCGQRFSPLLNSHTQSICGASLVSAARARPQWIACELKRGPVPQAAETHPACPYAVATLSQCLRAPRCGYRWKVTECPSASWPLGGRQLLTLGGLA
jgi:hypothetical protein